MRRLLRDRNYRKSEGVFAVEGPKLVLEAIESDARVESVFAVPGDATSAVVDAAARAGLPTYAMSTDIVARVADAVTPQPAFAVVATRSFALDDLRAASFLLVMVDVRDPGNAGTLLRTAEAAGAGGVVCCERSVDPFNPKTVRASAGAIFRVPVAVGGEPAEVLAEIGSWDVKRVGTLVRGGRDYADIDFSAPVALVLGNEATGLPEASRVQLDELVTIPMAGGESLNVGAAAAVLSFEVARQRRNAGAEAARWT